MGDAIAATNAHTNTNMTATVLIATSATAPASPVANAVPTDAAATSSTGIMSVRKQKWDTMFEKMKSYAAEQGHCNFRWYIEQENMNGTKLNRIISKLARWVQEQRRLYRVKKIDSKKIEALESIRFRWKLRNYNPGYAFSKVVETKLEVQFNTMVARVALHVEENGHGWIPSRYEGDKQLSDWAVRVRYQKKAGKLSEERMMAFKKDGFQW